MYRAARWVARRLGMLPAGGEFDSDTLATKLTFMAAQLIYTGLTLLPMPLLYRSYGAGLALIIFWCAVVLNNGASFYFEVFSRRYAAERGLVKPSSASESEATSSGGDASGESEVDQHDPDAAPRVTSRPSPTSSTNGVGGAGAMPVHSSTHDVAGAAANGEGRRNAATGVAGEGEGEPPAPASRRRLRGTSSR